MKRVFAAVLLSNLWVSAAASDRIAQGAQPEPATKAPVCFDKKSDIDTIMAAQKANKGTKHKYKGYRELFAKAGLTDEEIMARLVYAESKAANCAKHESAISKYIAGAVANRIAKRNGNILNVVFERDNFASSLNNYGESRYMDFLCPKDAGRFATVLEESRAALAKSPLPKDAVHYYLYAHATRFKPPKWTKTFPEARIDEELKSCIRFFNNPNW